MDPVRLVCPPFERAYGHVVVPGSVKRHCTRCTVAVLVSPSSLDRHGDNPESFWCTSCSALEAAAERMRGEEVVLVMPSETQRDELHALGYDDDDIAAMEDGVRRILDGRFDD